MLSLFRRTILLTVMIAAVAGFPAAHAQTITTVEVAVDRGDGTTTAATVHAPTGATGRPGVVLVHGSGDGSGEHYDHVAEAFARAGIVALRYDKRTQGYTPAHRDYSLLADDALAGLTALRNRPEVDPARVGLWGLSEGGWVAPLAASRSAEAAFLITVAANSVAPAAQQAWANETRFGAAGVRGSMVDVLARNGIRQLVAADQFAQADYDPIPVLRRITQPVLAIWGDQDRLTPPGDSLRDFRAAFDSVEKKNYALRTLPNAQHAGQPTTDGFDKLPGLVPGYGELMGDWVNGLPASATPPSADLPAVQGHSVQALTPASWWESTTAQLSLLVGMILALGGYACTGMVKSWRLPDRLPARVLICTAVIGVVGTVVQLGYVLTTRATSFGPLLFGRTLPWLALQLVAFGAVVALAFVLARARHTLAGANVGARTRWALLVCGGAGFVLWALYWGLLLP
ncbi:alpha/beta hydrolase family protein [Nocardia sp. NPDC058633]|uniref:alpha/beta hydrolase family protein n=1 Tax=Nocardia sp. NPDC058633 TaxID=3346568 RepID=UPI00365B5B01